MEGLSYNSGRMSFKKPYRPAAIVNRKPTDKHTGFNHDKSNGISPETPVKMQPVVKQQAAKKILDDLDIVIYTDYGR